MSYKAPCKAAISDTLPLVVDSEAVRGMSLRSAVAIAVVGVLLLLPVLIDGVHETHSSKFTYVWARQFADEFWSGNLYPRWLPKSFDGLGSPAFIFYPPLAFYVDAIVAGIVTGLADLPHRLAVDEAVLLVGSGIAMHAWLSSARVAPRAALAAALLYMAAPYHLYDHYTRGAFAESAFFTVLPLAMLGLRAAAKSQRGIAGLGVAFACLILAHLPSALLTSLILVPTYLMFQMVVAPSSAWPGVLRRCVAGLALGLGLAGVYIVPALTLQDTICAEVLWSEYHTPLRWLLIYPVAWPNLRMWFWMTVRASGIAVLSIGVLLSVRNQHEARLWAQIGLLCVLLMAGIAPWFWTVVPFIPKVQFPWRVLSSAEFAGITALALAMGNMSRRSAYGTMIPSAVLLGSAALVLAGQTAADFGQSRAYWDRFETTVGAHMVDASEYLPHGFKSDENGEFTGPGADYVRCGLNSSCTLARLGREGAEVTIDADRPTEVVVGRFFFKGWQGWLGGGPIQLRPTDDERLVSFSVPAGHSMVSIRMERTAPEVWGLIVSLLAGLALVGCLLGCRYTSALSVR